MSTQQVFRLPDLGEGLTEAEILDWRVAVGEAITVDQVVVVVETAKAAVEVPCPYAGRVVSLHGATGDLLAVGRPLITVEPLGVVTADIAATETFREHDRASSGSVLVGYGTGERHGRRRRRVPSTPSGASQAHVPSSVLTTVPSPLPAAGAGDPTPPDGTGPPDSAVRVISPIVRQLAREAGLDLAALCASGPGGVVRRADIETALPGAATPAGAAVVAGSPAAQLTRDEVRIPLRGVHRAVADKMSLSRREIPEVTVWVDADATNLLQARAEINATFPDRPVSVLALLARICVHALQHYPQLNSHVDTQRQEIVQLRRIHLGVATQTDRGLVVPVIRGATGMTTAQLAGALSETTASARAGTLSAGRLTGGTFTLNNYGVFGVDGSTPIINYPEVAILGIGRIADKPWGFQQQVALRKVVQLTLAFDHRVCDGGVAGAFLRLIADCVERPATLLFDV